MRCCDGVGREDEDGGPRRASVDFHHVARHESSAVAAAAAASTTRRTRLETDDGRPRELRKNRRNARTTRTITRAITRSSRPAAAVHGGPGVHDDDGIRTTLEWRDTRINFSDRLANGAPAIDRTVASLFFYYYKKRN